MRVRTRTMVRPALLAMLLLGVAAVRIVEGHTYDPLSSLHRVISHPGKYLEDATYSLDDEVSMKQTMNAKRWWKTAGAHPSMDFATADTADIPSRFSNNGGFLQLCLLLAFCLAVVCCAGVTINPWYKAGDVRMLRRLAAGLGGGFTFLSNLMLARLTIAIGAKHERGSRTESIQKGHDGRMAAQSQLQPSKKTAKGKKRRISHTGTHNTTAHTTQPRSIEKTISNASDDTSNFSMDVELGPSGSVASSEQESTPIATVVMTPADAQIARLEAEAQERELHRLAKQKRHAKPTLVSAKPVEEASQQSVELETPPVLSKAATTGMLRETQFPSRPEPNAGKAENREKVESREKATEHKDGAKGKPERKNLDIDVKAFARRSKENRGQDQLRWSEGDAKDRPARKTVYPERSPGSVPQVLVVPRKSLFNKNRPDIQAVLEEQMERSLAPHTPDRGIMRSNGQSSLSSPQSMASPSRPYAEVARENLPKPACSTAFVPPPPPPPPRKISALPKSAVYAQEFTPAAHRSPAAALEMLRPVDVPLAQLGPRVLGRSSAPSMCSDLEIPGTLESGDTMLSTPSPFPGMSMNRKRNGLPVTSMYSNVLPVSQSLGMQDFGLSLSTFTSRAPSSTESDPYINASLAPGVMRGPQNIWSLEARGLGFPIMDHIWSRNIADRLEPPSLWAGNSELVSDVSLASSSDLGSGVFGRFDPPLLAMGHSSL